MKLLASVLLAAPLVVGCSDDGTGSGGCGSPGGKVSAVVHTTAGDLNLLMDAGKHPCEVEAFLGLVEAGHYDGSPCPWLGTRRPELYLECGPGTADLDLPDGGERDYPAGTVGLADDGSLVLVYADAGWRADTPVLGTVDVSSIRLLQQVASAGVDDASQPARPVDVVDVVIR